MLSFLSVDLRKLLKLIALYGDNYTVSPTCGYFNLDCERNLLDLGLHIGTVLQEQDIATTYIKEATIMHLLSEQFCLSIGLLPSG